MKQIIILLIILTSIIIAYNGPDDSEPNIFDINHYKADIRFPNSDDLRYLEAVSEIHFEYLDENIEKTFEFHLEGLTIDSILDSQGDLLSYQIMNDDDLEKKYYLVRKELGDLIPPIKIYYHGDSRGESFSKWGGVQIDNRRGIHSIGVGFSNPYVSTTRHWLACYDHPNDKASYELTFSVPEGLFVASVGRLIDSSTADGISSYTWATEFDISSYLINFAFDDFEITRDSFGDIPIEIYHTDIDKVAVDFAFQNLDKMAEGFTKQLSEPYNFEKIGFFLMAEPAAMEQQTLIAINQFIVRGYHSQRDSNGSTISHELAHHWFGNLVSPKDFRDAWLNESFASFCEALYLEYYYGNKAAFWEKIREDANSFFNGILPSEGAIPIYGYNREESSNYPGTIYRKGSIALSQLRHKMGDDLFFKAIEDYLDKYKFKNASTQDLKNTFEESSGMDLNTFFDEWIYGNGFPMIGYYFTTEGNETHLNVNQEQIEFWYRFSELELGVSWENENGETQESIFEIGKAENKILLGNNIDVSTVRVNELDNFYTPTRMTILNVDERKNEDSILRKIDDNIYQINNETFIGAQVSLVATDGRLIKSKYKIRDLLDLNHYSKGMYLVLLQKGYKQIIEKIVIK